MFCCCWHELRRVPKHTAQLELWLPADLCLLLLRCRCCPPPCGRYLFPSTPWALSSHRPTRAGAGGAGAVYATPRDLIDFWHTVLFHPHKLDPTQATVGPADGLRDRSWACARASRPPAGSPPHDSCLDPSHWCRLAAVEAEASNGEPVWVAGGMRLPCSPGVPGLLVCRCARCCTPPTMPAPLTAYPQALWLSHRWAGRAEHVCNMPGRSSHA